MTPPLDQIREWWESGRAQPDSPEDWEAEALGIFERGREDVGALLAIADDAFALAEYVMSLEPGNPKLRRPAYRILAAVAALSEGEPKQRAETGGRQKPPVGGGGANG